MHLRRVEIFGFKSFPEKVVLELGPGMTCVVGPNGCGKTNISDAVRWALGEHNIRLLRGKLLEDIIFNGSPRRDPLGMAEVTLVFGGAAQELSLGMDEVSITRRVFRSGESEFFLNGIPCRLREITDRFLDRGLGHRGYAIIEREMVDRVLEDASRERRALLEEAAGIARYKAREKAAERKLELTEQDLRRIQDIVGEVERRVDSLRRQGGRAERYRELEGELRATEALSLRTEHRALAERGHELAATRREIALHLEGLRIELRTIETRRETVRLAREEAERDLARAEAELGAVAREAAEREGRVKVLRERQRSLAAEAARADEEAGASVERGREALRRHEEGGAESARLAGEVKALLERLGEEREALAAIEREHRARTRELEEKRSASLAALEERVSRSTEVQSARRELEGITLQEREIARQERELEEERARHQEEERTRSRAQDELSRALERAEEERANLRRRLSVLADEKERWEKREQELATERHGFEARLALLRELEERFVGFSRSVREVMQEARAGSPTAQGVRGVVGELLAAGDGRLTRALEAALAEGLDCVVTEDLDSARSLVSFLREGRRGRATFLPLEAFSGNGDLEPAGKARKPTGGARSRASAICREKGILGEALDFVSCAERFRPVARFLLADTVVAESLDVAERLAGDPAYAMLRFVTLNGECFRAPGVVTGGSLPEGEGSPFNRGRRIAEVERAVAERTEESEKTQKLRAGAVRDIEQAERQLGELERELERIRHAAEEERGELRRLEGVLAGITSRGALLVEERERAVTERKRVEEHLAQLTAQHRRLEESGREAQDVLVAAEDEVRRLATSRDETGAGLHQVELQLTALGERERTLAQELPRLVAEGEAAARAEERQRLAAREARAEMERVAQEMGAEEEALRQFGLEVKARGEKRDVAAARSGEKAEEERREERHLARVREQIHEAGEEMHRAELGEKEVQVASDNLQRRAPAGFDFGEPLDEEMLARVMKENRPDEPPTKADKADPVETLQARVEELRDKIRHLGPVNFVALEEYATEKDRLDFLTQQRDDLIRSRDALQEATRRINRTARQRFLECFDEVRVHFKETFTLLFDEGDADLSLPEGLDPLDCPIEIMAKPRGKSLREVSLLSGGERALSALALLVALYRVKPSPFCIMDEVDAPLDDSNVLRFTSMLHRLRQGTQFIVVTHNKRTMEAADALYGVTMEEAGVSSVVGVRMEEAARWAISTEAEAEAAGAQALRA